MWYCCDREAVGTLRSIFFSVGVGPGVAGFEVRVRWLSQDLGLARFRDHHL